MTWTNEHISILIEAYEQNPCLYFVKHKDYHNKMLRNLALTKVVKEVRTLRPTCTEQEVRKKFLGLRTTYVGERKRVLESLRSGIGEDEVYQPSLWYYSKMAFLNEHLITRLSRSSLTSPECSEPEVPQESLELERQSMENPNLDISQCELGDFSDFDVDGVLPATSPLTIDSLSTPARGGLDTLRNKPCGAKVAKTPLKRPKTCSETDALNNISQGLGKVAGAFQLRHQPSTATKTAEDIMGEFVAAQLKKIKRDDVKEDAQFEIHRILRDALRK